ncbi:RNA-directed DNA polymerase [Tenacibaculum finnmarkense]|uniref:reverse transcriptase domain-containing protein n=1 Tax=Tenacibaculum finnmarkense TaxID=2781243 RepID=UPI001EFAE627|nr:reverse transcriptase domain-containing protein [Tenacibaculum finnmarkense]MCG8807431.1 RNA-directed DNA polymerase [Tenacibaculum finnmarkense]MCG8817650.1 RNA-directed DNA polymerase [Tenacibaculum finnmarkense]
MKIEQQHIELIRTTFSTLQTKEDLLSLLNLANTLLYPKNSFKFELKQLTYFANPKLVKNRYAEFTIKKKSGANRIINAPTQGLKSILKTLNFVLQCMCEPHKAATGFVRGKSITDNAKKHIDSNYVYNIDLKDFFHSFDLNRVKLGFMQTPFNLRNESFPIAFILACLSTYTFKIDGEIKQVLPQGSPTSPTITNILCRRLDKRLTGLANRFGLRYTRYADDITFSSQHNVYNKEDFQNELHKIIVTDEKFAFNTKKTRLQKHGYQQEVTGLIVNEKVNVRSRYVKQVRMWLYYWEKYGYNKAEQVFRKDYIKDKGHVKKTLPNLDNVLEGKLLFLKMVKGEYDGTYMKLQNRFEKLNRKQNHIDEILALWDSKGIDLAKNKFYNNDDDDENSHNTIVTDTEKLSKINETDKQYDIANFCFRNITGFKKLYLKKVIIDHDILYKYWENSSRTMILVSEEAFKVLSEASNFDSKNIVQSIEKYNISENKKTKKTEKGDYNQRSFFVKKKSIEKYKLMF